MKTAKTKYTVLAALVLEVARTERCASITDLAEAVKCRAARLRIPYDAGSISAAIAQAEAAGHQLLTPPPSAPPAAPEEPAPLGRDEAGKRYKWIKAELKKRGYVVPEREIKTVSAVRQLGGAEIRRRAFEQERAKAARIYAQAIAEQYQRCEALEAAVVDDEERVEQ